MFGQFFILSENLELLSPLYLWESSKAQFGLRSEVIASVTVSTMGSYILSAAANWLGWKILQFSPREFQYEVNKEEKGRGKAGALSVSELGEAWLLVRRKGHVTLLWHSCDTMTLWQEEYLEIVTGRVQQQIVEPELSDCAASVGKETDKRDG